MPQPPKELIDQIEIIASAINSVNDLIDNDKIKIDNYGKDFLEPLTKIRTKSMDLRNDLEIFKTNMEKAVTDQYYTNNRFASKVNGDIAKSVVDKFLSSNSEY